MSSTVTSSTFVRDLSVSSRREKLHIEKRRLADSVRIESMHHRNHSTYVRAQDHEILGAHTHKLKTLKEELHQLHVEKQERKKVKMMRDLQRKRLALERAQMVLREKIAQQEEKLIRKEPATFDLRPIDSQPHTEKIEDPYLSTSSEEADHHRNRSEEPETLLLNKGTDVIRIHLIGRRPRPKKLIVKYTEEEASSPSSPGLHWLRLWGMLKRKRKPLPSPPPPRREVKARMLDYYQRVKQNFSPVVSPEKQVETQLRAESEGLKKQFQRVPLGQLGKPTHVSTLDS